MSSRNAPAGEGMLPTPFVYEDKHCLVYCGPERCNCMRGKLDRPSPPGVPPWPLHDPAADGRADAARLAELFMASLNEDAELRDAVGKR